MVNEPSRLERMTGKNYRTAPCHICAQESYSWGYTDGKAFVPVGFGPLERERKLQRGSLIKAVQSAIGAGGTKLINARVCNTCGNIQLFVEK